MLSDVLQNYRVALERWLPFLAAHLFIRLAITALIVPVIGLLLATTLVFSDQTALTDQDIARFFLTPAGALGAVIVLSMLLVAIVLDVIVATAIIRQGPKSPIAALRLAAGFTLHSVRRLFPFVARFILRVLVIALPFLAVAGAIAWLFLTEFDINYYLTEHPPEFLIAAGLIGVILAVLILILLSTLSGWAVAMHLAVFDRVPASEAFTKSREAMQGNRLTLAARLVIWFVLRAIAAAIVGSVAAALVASAADGDVQSTQRMIWALALISLGYAASNTLINALSNGALADLLNDEFDRALFGRSPADDISTSSLAKPLFARDGVIITAVVVLSMVGLGTGGLLLERAADDTEAVVIAHRGAAAEAPENTMAAVERAIADGADWIEIDVQEDAEGRVIVAHDSDFMKAAGSPTKVWDVTSVELAGLDIGSWFDPSFSDERVPLLSDVLLAAKGKSNVLIELKYYGHDVDLENRVAQIVEDTGMTDQIATMSLKYPAVKKMLAIRPDWSSGVLAATSVGDLTGLDGDFLALNQARITARSVQKANEAGKDVYAWTVNDPLSMMRMLWIGIDGLITDDPALARQVIADYNTLSIPERLLLTVSDRISVTLDPEQVDDERP